MQIDRTNWAEIVLEEFPAFRAQWDEHLAAWNPIIARPLALDVAEFTDLALKIIWAGDEREVDRLANAIELMLVAGDAIVKYTVRQMLLAKIASSSQIDGFPIERFTNAIQPQTAYHWQTAIGDRRVDLSIHH